MNYTTLPFYWGGYEPEAGKTGAERLEAMAQWCADHDIIPKGHPLVWHEVYPTWADAYSDEEVLSRLEARVRKIVSTFKEAILWWDVVNEATVSADIDNTVGRWIARKGAAECVTQALTWAHEANPSAGLLYNDFNVSEDFERLVSALQQRKAPLAAIGIQSHMHKGTWPIEKVWQVCETYARYGLPLHFTETTVLSGRLKAQDDNEWHKHRTDWDSTPEGEAFQMEYGEEYYTTLFSHPAVEAITWWDFSDYGSWQGAPAGFLRKDMSPKPLYERLMELVHKRWHTDVQTRTDGQGRATVRCFFGEHQVTAKRDSGEILRGTFAIERKGERAVDVTLS